MSRPKVPDDKRQRTAQACENCKRRKQKCDGLKPCLKCSEKSISCVYRGVANATDNGSSSDISEPSLKRRRGLQAIPGNASDGGASAVSLQLWEGNNIPTVFEAGKPVSGVNNSQVIPHNTVEDVDEDSKSSIAGEMDMRPRSNHGSMSVAEEDTALYSTTRMLRDQTGRMLYIGESATLSFLHLIRMMVESTSGHSPFTTDPRQDRIVEHLITLPQNVQPPCMLADRSTADILVSAYFVNTSGLIDIFDRREFTKAIDECYANPLLPNNHFLCLLYLTFAIGMVVATPEPGSTEDIIIRRLRNQPYDQAELFFRSAKCLGDPLGGFEDADYWSVQALLLMSVYAQFVSKRNASYAYHGMAVRSAIALGLHREETMSSFKGLELRERSHIWKSLYIFDRYLAASLGRPPTISDSDCWGEARGKSSPGMPQSLIHPVPLDPSTSDDEAHVKALDVSVKVSHIIGSILRKVYAKRKVSNGVAQEIANKCRLVKPDLDNVLRWQQAVPGNASARERVSHIHGVSILHSHLMYNYSLVLLTRPFFLLLIQAHHQVISRVSRSLRTRTEKFAEVCVAASFHSISIIQTARRGKYLSQRNVLVIYFLFTSTLVVMANYFMGVFDSPNAETTISQAISLMEYFAETDMQGKRLLWILRAFEDVIHKQPKTAKSRTFRLSLSSGFVSGHFDPAELFLPAPQEAQKGCPDMDPSKTLPPPGTLLHPNKAESAGPPTGPSNEILCGSPINGTSGNGKTSENGQILQKPQALYCAVSMAPTAPIADRESFVLKSGEVLMSPAPARALPPRSHLSSPVPGYIGHNAHGITSILNSPHTVSVQQQLQSQPAHPFFNYGYVQGSTPADLESLDSYGDAADTFDFDCLWNWAQSTQNHSGGPPFLSSHMVDGPGGLHNTGLGIDYNGGDTSTNRETNSGGGGHEASYSFQDLNMTSQGEVMNGNRGHFDANSDTGGLGPIFTALYATGYGC